MKKILLIMLLTFTSLTFAADGRYTIVADARYGVYILDTKDGSVRYCQALTINNTLMCTEPNEDKN